MQNESRQIRIYIKSKNEDIKDVPITLIASYFQNLQNILYQICEDINEDDCRHAGRYPGFIVENCELVLKKMTINSSDAIVGLSQTQTSLPFPDIGKTLGERAILKTNDVFEIVRQRDNIYPDLSPVILDEGRRYNILSEVDEIWPDENSKYDVKIGIGKIDDKNLRELNPKRKPKIKQALEQEITQSERTISGRLVELNVTKKHYCQIETPDGNIFCKYKPDIEDVVRSNTGNFVSISGMMADAHTILLESESAIKGIKTISIQQIKIDDKLIDLKSDVVLDVNYDKIESKYIVDSKSFNIFAINSVFNLAIEDIQEQMGMLWKGYVQEDVSNLTKSAIEFRKVLKKLIGE